MEPAIVLDENCSLETLSFDEELWGLKLNDDPDEHVNRHED